MNILVCIKQVPGTNKVEVDEETGVLKRDGIESKMNPYDLYALETALRIKEEVNGRITVISMGPPQAGAIIREAYMMGVDEGYLLSDRAFAGADVLATSFTLSQGIKSIGDFDLIICGKQTTDGDTAQVGPAIAEHLNIPHAAWVSKINEVDNKGIVIEQDLAESVEIIHLDYPCLITVEKDIVQPRLPSYKKKLETRDKPVKMLGLKDFPDRAEKKYGLLGSPTRVEKVFPPESNSERILIEGSSGELVNRCYDTLKRLKFI